MSVRQAGVTDIEALAQLRAAWRGQPASTEFVVGFRDWFFREESSRWWWVADQGSQLVGMVNLKLFDRMPSPDMPATRWGYLANLFVLPACRGEGVGAALVAAAVERARDDGLVRLVLSPSELSVPLYDRYGFRPATDLLRLHLDAEIQSQAEEDGTDPRRPRPS